MKRKTRAMNERPGQCELAENASQPLGFAGITVGRNCCFSMGDFSRAARTADLGQASFPIRGLWESYRLARDELATRSSCCRARLAAGIARKPQPLRNLSRGRSSASPARPQEAGVEKFPEMPSAHNPCSNIKLHFHPGLLVTQMQSFGWGERRE